MHTTALMSCATGPSPERCGTFNKLNGTFNKLKGTFNKWKEA